MTIRHRNKTLATFLAAIAGSIGAHRFYLHGWHDKWGWLHFSTLPASFLISGFFFGQDGLVRYSPLIISFLSATLSTLILGLTSDEKWDTLYNPESTVKSDSTWPLALILVLSTGIGAMTLIAVIARTFDLLYTGGAYG